VLQRRWKPLDFPTHLCHPCYREMSWWRQGPPCAHCRCASYTGTYRLLRPGLCAGGACAAAAACGPTNYAGCGVEEAGVRAQGSAEADNPGGTDCRTRTHPRGRWQSSSSTLGASSWRDRGGVTMVAAVRVGEKRRAQRRFKYRWPSKLTCAHTSMPPQELRRHAQWSATNLMAKRCLRSAFCRRVASKRALTHRFPKFGAPMGRSGRVCPFGSPNGACAACLPVSTNRFGQPKIIWVSPL
jgi:hypothetical protein